MAFNYNQGFSPVNRKTFRAFNNESCRVVVMFRGDRLAKLMEAKGLSQSELARRVGVTQATIWKLLKEPSQGSKHLHKIAAELETTSEFLMDETEDPATGAVADRRPPFRGAEAAEPDMSGMVMVKEIDLVLGFGGQFLDVPIEERVIPFPEDWLRQFSRAPVEHLVFMRGRGESMKPTLLDGDICLIDLSRKRLDEQDELWAVAYGEIGMLKRLRRLADGTVRILSDNPVVPEELATDGELYILGRCCGVFRKT